MSTYKACTDVHPFTYEDRSGNEVNYRLCVITGAQRDSYIKELRTKITKDAQGKPDIKNPEGLTALILTYATQRNDGTEDTPDWKPVKLIELQDWPAPMQSELNEIALKMSGLDKESVSEAKND